MSEDAWFFTRLEFAVLLMVGNVNEIGCFTLPDAKQVDERQIIQAVYELVDAGCLKTDGKFIRMTSPVKKLMESVQKSEGYLIIDPGDQSLPQKNCYMGNEITVLENLQEEGKAFRLSSLEKDEFWKWMENCLGIPEPDKGTDMLPEQEAVTNREKELLLNCCYPGVYRKLSEWMNQVGKALDTAPYAGLRYVTKNEKDRQMDLVLCRGIWNTWIVWCCPKKDVFSENTGKDPLYVRPDSEDCRKKILSLFSEFG